MHSTLVDPSELSAGVALTNANKTTHTKVDVYLSVRVTYTFRLDDVPNAYSPDASPSF